MGNATARSLRDGGMAGTCWAGCVSFATDVVDCVVAARALGVDIQGWSSFFNALRYWYGGFKECESARRRESEVWRKGVRWWNELGCFLEVSVDRIEVGQGCSSS